MIWWKEWRETRFGFLMILFFMAGLYASMPVDRTLGEDYYIGVFLAFFGMAIAVVLGAGALAPEVESETIVFLLSKPLGRTKYLMAKYFVRGGEALVLVAVPLGFLALRDWERHTVWMWCSPYLAVQYIVIALGLIAFTFSGAFFFSVLFKKQALSALGGVTLLVAYFAWTGIGILRRVGYGEVVETDILVVLLLVFSIFVGTLILFRAREF